MPKVGYKHSQSARQKMSKTKSLLKPAEQRFWKNVVKIKGKGCWLWVGDPGKEGYGRIWIGQRSVPAHRYSWILNRGPIPSELQVLHRCDRPGCVRPDHLFLGTHRQNVDDMLAKGRSLKGEKHNNAKLVEAQVIYVLKWKPGSGEMLKDVAARFGVSIVALELIRSGRNWRHLYHHHSKFEKVRK